MHFGSFEVLPRRGRTGRPQRWDAARDTGRERRRCALAQPSTGSARRVDACVTACIGLLQHTSGPLALPLKPPHCTAGEARTSRRSCVRPKRGAIAMTRPPIGDEPRRSAGLADGVRLTSPCSRDAPVAAGLLLVTRTVTAAYGGGESGGAVVSADLDRETDDMRGLRLADGPCHEGSYLLQRLAAS